jgi:hypothetical protein
MNARKSGNGSRLQRGKERAGAVPGGSGSGPARVSPPRWHAANSGLNSGLEGPVGEDEGKLVY